MIRSAVVLTLLVSAAAAGAPRYERRIDVARAGPQRLDVDLPLLAGSSQRFADLRVHDPSGHEVPYLLIEPSGRDPVWIRSRRFVIVPTKTTSGIEADAGNSHLVDAIRIEGIAAPFLKRARIEGSGDRHRWTLLADTTVFKLPADGLERTEVAFQPSQVRYVRITWDDSSSARVAGVARIRLRLHGSGSPPPPLRSQVALEPRPSEPGRTRYRIRLPAAGLPVTAVELTIPRGDVYRPILISEPRLGGSEIVPVTLGSGELRQAERNGIVAAKTRVTIAPPASDELDLVIDDGSNAPLHITGATLELTPQPWIYFEAAQAGAFIARYGDRAIAAPRYDLEAARRFVERATLATAQWQPQALRSTAAPTRSAPYPSAGAPIDRSSFEVARPLGTAVVGMAVLPLDADVIARSRELADVRIVDPSSRQVPFIVEQRNEPLMIDVPLGSRVAEEGNVSRYVLRMPYQTLPSGSRLVIRTVPGVFERQITLTDQPDQARDPRVLASAQWRHTDPDRDPPPLALQLPARIATQLDLRIEEGDNAPLAISSVRLILPSFALRFIHPGTALTLLYGNAAAHPPKYDLALLASRLFHEPAVEIGFAGKDVARAAAVNVERRFFWIAIGVVALALLALLARVLRPAAQSGPP